MIITGKKVARFVGYLALISSISMIFSNMFLNINFSGSEIFLGILAFVWLMISTQKITEKKLL